MLQYLNTKNYIILKGKETKNSSMLIIYYAFTTQYKTKCQASRYTARPNFRGVSFLPRFWGRTTVRRTRPPAPSRRRCPHSGCSCN